VKNGVFLANEKQVHILQKKFVGSTTIYCSKQNKRKLKTKVKTLQEKRIVHEAIKI
jgi:hypothetical protein